ncbi:MAG: aminotransferase class V-fold PLP-dependent enzyme [Emcibacteraceae bacterium]|nr:aminotransferase class V-fold PLP-dependent enzyme [Emcibacteraceae bacterium]MDG1727712.1 aminotransferase class V-fold PLP-dependent enzyme [Emcibacteraceae bacterium]
MSQSRRNFLKAVGASAGMSALYMSGSNTMALAAGDVRAMATAQNGMTGTEIFWDKLPNEFIIEKDLIMLNAANMTPTPKVVHETVIEHTRDMEMNCSFQNRGKYGGLMQRSRDFIAGFLGADADEIGFVRNTSEANNTVINGLDLGPDDEVLIWDQNHPCNNIAWYQRAERLGFKVVTVSTDPKLNAIEDLIRPFKEAINSKTKVLAFSHISNQTGTTLPGKELTQLAHANGAKSLVDGAQTFGYMDIDLHDMGCDFYTSSGQKWILGPREASFIYVKKEAQAELWPNIVTVGWERSKVNGAQKYESLGQRDDGRLWALGRAVEFHNMIGQTRIEERINALAGTLRNHLSEQVRDIDFLTEQADGFNSGIVVALISNTDAKKAAKTIYENYRISGAIGGNGDVLRVRLCPHIYNSMDQMERTAKYISLSI